jgi:HEAT repeat protein
MEVLEDREQEVRILAVRVLSALPPTCMRTALFDLARSREIQKRSFLERKEVFQALGRVRDLEIEEWLIKTLRKKGLFRSDDRDEVRACAAIALGKNGSERALEALASCVKDRSPTVRRAVAQALRPEEPDDSD